MNGGSFVPLSDSFSADSPADQDGKSTGTVGTSSSSVSPSQSLEFESEKGIFSSVSSSDHELVYQPIEGLEKLEWHKPKRRRRRWRIKKKYSVNGRQVCYCAASFAADCAAVCCCPCALLHLFVLALVKVPFVVATKALCYAKQKVRIKCKKKKKNDNIDDSVDNNPAKTWRSTPPWSCIQSPQSNASLDGSLGPTFETREVWSELHAGDHMGFWGFHLKGDWLITVSVFAGRFHSLKVSSDLVFKRASNLQHSPSQIRQESKVFERAKARTNLS